ncbi:endonuclease SmrB [Paraglaciecola sp. L1A13]|uniref:endonuclease SmrB n=1 Tax=Paraglaciecola sp. L1A13 TaxID=2686359 RepID=UPI00131B68E7|nr:endonuclease SmrB [Paraglaciecola sp. L1A13]
MKKNATPESSDTALFRSEFTDVKPLKQDKIPPQRFSSKLKSTLIGKKHDPQSDLKQQNATFQFSDGFEGYFDTSQPLKYVQPGADTFEVKRLRRGEYPPDLILDLHGLNKEQAKLEIAALIYAAQKQHYHCVCIVHGIGSYVLKKNVPNWLIQHPSVKGFHQAPLEWGGQGAVLVLIDLPQINSKY